MAATVMKVEAEAETCGVCGGGGELLTPEEHDADAPPMQVPLRAMLLHLNNNKVVPEGRLCVNCVRRTIEAYDFSNAISTRGVPPLSEKIRALRRRLHELTQKIDVFIVVGGAGASAGGAYSEDDIIMVERDALAAAAAADDEDLERARNARGDTVYQCSVCPLSFQRVSEYREHAATHPRDALHSCWTCGAQFATRDALRDHADAHAALHALTCHLCHTDFQCQAEARRHEAECGAGGVGGAGGAACPACGARAADRAALAAHAAAAHSRAHRPPHLCPACFAAFDRADLLTAHLLRHRQAKQFVCGYDGCILRFGTRSNLMSHIRKCHGGGGEADAPDDQPPSTTCQHCDRTFGSVAAMKRHARVHRAPRAAHTHAHLLPHQEETTELSMEVEELEGEVEYLEVETLEDVDYREEEVGEMDNKPELTRLH